eukprot:7229318-Pyramimonas_sp.AAC.1
MSDATLRHSNGALEFSQVYFLALGCNKLVVPKVLPKSICRVRSRQVNLGAPMPRRRTGFR